MIDVRDLCFSYGQTPVLRHVSFRIGRGERSVLLGRSGLGKTTLLHLLCGLLQPGQGTIHVPARLGVVFQEDRLIPGLTAADNIRLVCPGLPETELAALAGSLELTPYLGQRPAALSGGQKRRVAIARALAFDCGALLLDEPFKGLDPAIRQQTARCIAGRLAGRPLLLISHDPEDASLLGARLLRLEELNHPGG